MKPFALAAAGLLLACAARPPAPPVVAPAEPTAIPAHLQYCPKGVAAPPAPKPPRTVEAVAAWATAVDNALVATEAARLSCARRLYDLNDLVDPPIKDN